MTAPTETPTIPPEMLARTNRFRRIMGLPELKNIEIAPIPVNPEISYLTKSPVPQDVAPQINYAVLQETGEQR